MLLGAVDKDIQYHIIPIGIGGGDGQVLVLVDKTLGLSLAIEAGGIVAGLGGGDRGDFAGIYCGDIAILV